MSLRQLILEVDEDKFDSDLNDVVNLMNSSLSKDAEKKLNDIVTALSKAYGIDKEEVIQRIMNSDKQRIVVHYEFGGKEYTAAADERKIH